MDGPGAGRRRVVLRAAARLRRQPVRDPGRAGGRGRPEPEPGSFDKLRDYGGVAQVVRAWDS